MYNTDYNTTVTNGAISALSEILIKGQRKETRYKTGSFQSVTFTFSNHDLNVQGLLDN